MNEEKIELNIEVARELMCLLEVQIPKFVETIIGAMPSLIHTDVVYYMWNYLNFMLLELERRHPGMDIKGLMNRTNISQNKLMREIPIP